MENNTLAEQSLSKDIDQATRPITRRAKLSKWLSYAIRAQKWLPHSHSRSLLILLLFVSIQTLFFFIPILTPYISINDFPWKSSENIFISISGYVVIDIIIMFLMVNSLFLASCCRHYTTFNKSISELAGGVLMAVVISVVILSAAKGASDEFSKEFLGLKLWLGSYGLLSAYALKPMLDEMLERMYPKPKRAEDPS